MHICNSVAIGGAGLYCWPARPGVVPTLPVSSMISAAAAAACSTLCADSSGVATSPLRQYQLRFLVARCLRQLIDRDCNDLAVGAILSLDGERTARNEFVTRKEMRYINLCPAREPVGLTYEPLAAAIADSPQRRGLPGGSQHVRRFQHRSLTAVVFCPPAG